MLKQAAFIMIGVAICLCVIISLQKLPSNSSSSSGGVDVVATAIYFAEAAQDSTEKIEIWLQSLKLSGFDGRIVFFVCGAHIGANQRQYIKNSGAEIVMRSFDEYDLEFLHPTWVNVNRFYVLYDWLRKQPTGSLRNVLFTDCFDVVFQTNPMQFVSAHLQPPLQLIAATEGILNADEQVWGWNVFKEYFGQGIRRRFADIPIYNAGVIAGTAQAMADLSLNIYLISKGREKGTIDQHAYNIILQMRPWKDVTLFTRGDEGWCCMARTMVTDEFPKKVFGSNVPQLLYHKTDHFGAYTPVGTPPKEYAVVHQYDKMEWSYKFQLNWKHIRIAKCKDRMCD